MLKRLRKFDKSLMSRLGNVQSGEMFQSTLCEWFTSDYYKNKLDIIEMSCPSLKTMIARLIRRQFKETAN